VDTVGTTGLTGTIGGVQSDVERFCSHTFWWSFQFLIWIGLGVPALIVVFVQAVLMFRWVTYHRVFERGDRL